MTKKVLLLVLSMVWIPQVLALAEEKICDIRFKNGKWEKFVILEFSSEGVEAIPFDLAKNKGIRMQHKQFIDKYDIDYVLCDTAIRFPEDDLPIRLMKYTEARRDPTLAGILSFVFIGGGQIYNKEVGKAAAFAISQVGVAYLVFENVAEDNIEAGILMLLVVPVLSMSDAVKSAHRINKTLKKKYNMSVVLGRQKDVFYCGLSLNF